MSERPVTASIPVVGRFAPSPTGPLHFGSVVAAAASYLSARSQAGRWLLRIDDLDPPREQAGAASQILRMLDILGLVWDGEVVYQSRRGEAYEAALAHLRARDRIYACGCSRATVGSGPYPGTCRNGVTSARQSRSLRVVTEHQAVTFADGIFGPCHQSLHDVCGDFVVKRADGLIAYHLAVVVDDADSGVNEVVRGADLLDSTPRQIYLQRLLGAPTPRYAHVPVVLGSQGEKLSKQTGAAPITPANACDALYHAVNFLGLKPETGMLGLPCAELLAWAQARWRPGLCGLEDRAYKAFAAANIVSSSA